MSFLALDDVIMLMDEPKTNGTLFSVPELRDLVAAGCSAGLIFDQPYMNRWADFEPEDGILEVDELDFRLDDYARAGMKAVVMGPRAEKPEWAPKSWFCYGEAGVMFDVLAPWVVEGRDRYLGLLGKVKNWCIDRGALVISPQLMAGETVMPNIPYWGGAEGKGFERPPAEKMDWLREQCRAWFMAQAAVLICKPYDESFFQLHRLIPQLVGTAIQGNGWIDDYLADVRSAFPGVTMNHISFTYFPHGPGYWNMVDRDRQWGVREWAGAEYCEGIDPNRTQHALIAKQRGLRGLLVSPCSRVPIPGQMHNELEPWMLTAIDAARKILLS
jgi:hypothetical protein